MIHTAYCSLPVTGDYWVVVVVVNASHTFYTASTNVPVDEDSSVLRKRRTKALNTTVNPEDKRRIIGDTFIRVSHFGVPVAHHICRCPCVSALGVVVEALMDVEMSRASDEGNLIFFIDK